MSVFKTREEAENYLSYHKSKFMRFLLKLAVSSVNISKEVFAFVPKQDFKKRITDQMMYEKYTLTDDEVAFVEKMIRPME